MALRALDTNAYVELLRGGPRVGAIRAALGGVGTDLVMLMPVMSDLQQGAPTRAEARALVVRFLDPVPAGRRVTADPAEWVATGARIAAMARAGHDRESLERRAFFLDVDIAQVCRSRGIVLWTDDADHDRIRVHVGHRVEPLPAEAQGRAPRWYRALRGQIHNSGQPPSRVTSRHVATGRRPSRNSSHNLCCSSASDVR